MRGGSTWGRARENGKGLGKKVTGCLRAWSGWNCCEKNLAQEVVAGEMAWVIGLPVGTVLKPPIRVYGGAPLSSGQGGEWGKVGYGSLR